MATEVKRASRFGQPTLASANNATVKWIRGSTSPLDQKGSTGWLAELYGGVQTGDDWARVNIPVSELSLPLFKKAMWSYYMTNTETMGVNIVLWVHDPRDFDKRAEITQLGGHADLPKTSGWNAFNFSPSTGGMFYYGEGTAGSGLTAGTQYTWSQFQADTIFKLWTIYRVTLEYGWEASGTFESAYIADIKLNEDAIELAPLVPTHKKTVIVPKALGAAAIYNAEDVLSESTSAGTDWDFDFGGTGYITSAMVISATTAITPRLVLFLFRAPPTCELDDHAANTAPLAADLALALPPIEFSAMKDVGTGMSYAVATPNTYGNVPIQFDTPIVYGVLVTLDAFTQGAGANMSVILGADMED